MSGIVGILNTDGAPVDRALLSEMTESMRLRGPDAQRMWIDGNVGFGHAQFVITDDASSERHPCTLDGHVWITADARIDGRDDLVRALAARGCEAHRAGDAELVLHAYSVWGEQCVDHLIGDFAFAVWDRPRRRLFCARDHFGVKPFYYALHGRALVFSNTLDCVRLHPDVSDELNDLAIADFLLFQRNQSLDTTSFADIQRLPGAHTLTWSNGHARVQRYWTLPLDREIRYKRMPEYVEHFTEILTTAVRDRLRTRQVGVMMSGGLDSTAVAATARRLLSQDGAPFELRASTIVYDHLIPDRERHYSRVAADALGIPIEYDLGDDAAPFARWGQPDLQTPEPVDEPFLTLLRDHYRRVASQGRVALTGWDGDVLFSEYPHLHFAALARLRKFGRLASALASYSWTFQTVPNIGVRTALARWRTQAQHGAEFPRWLNADLVRRLDLRTRWRQMTAPTSQPPVLRPRAVRILTSPLWLSFFETYDAGVTGVALDIRHPLADLRVVGYGLAIPAVPWCIRKTILRQAMRGLLPEAIRARSKTPLAGEPLIRFVDRPTEVRRLESMALGARLNRYVDSGALPSISGQISVDSVYLRLRPLSLNYWLQRTAPPPPRGARHEEERNDQVG